MSEKEIMLEIEEIKRIDRTRFTSSELQAIQGLLDLYNKEKEKNTELQNYMKEYLIPKSTINLLYISKDKIREEIKKKMKYLYVDSCAEDSGKYTAYMNVLNLLEEE